jgi:solute carrier family 25 (mitochondrial iron transporter), member 28/37
MNTTTLSSSSSSSQQQTKSSMEYTQHMFAGAFAGTMEHTVMFPVDTVKTRMQLVAAASSSSSASSSSLTSSSSSTSSSINMIKSTIPNAIRSILKTDGVKGLYRGVVAGGLGAGPAHAVYFATYEYGKKMFRLNPIGSSSSSSSSSSSAYGEFVADASAGALATIVGDAVQTPLDTVKQRMQMQLGGNCPSEVKAMSGEGIGGGSSSSRISMNSISSSSSNTTGPAATRKFKSAFDALRTIVRNEGAHVLYRSYPTTLIMNVPFTAIHVGLYESAKRALKIEEEDEGFRTQFLAGGFAGGIAGFLTTPMDVVKTRMQTHCEVALGCDVSKTVETATANQTCAVRGDPKLCVSTTTSSTPTPTAPPLSSSSRSVYASANAFKVARHVAEREGAKALFSGATARVLFHVPAAAICWTAYEFMKRNLGIEVDPSSAH